MKNFFYKVNDKEYEVEVIYKNVKNINYRFKNGKFVISCNLFVGKRQIISGLDRFAERLIKADQKTPPMSENSIYLFGQLYELNYPGTIMFLDEKLSIKDNDELMRKIKPVFKKYLETRVRYYEELMNVESYKVRVQNMKTRYGSNSKRTKTLNFNLALVHYDKEVIDSVVVHELAHILVFDHSKEFYNVVYRYCPEYPKYRKMLVKGIYHA